MASKIPQFFQHTQSSASVTWVIPHNFNVSEVAIDVVVDESGAREKILPLTVEMTDSNTVTVTFSSARTGVARVTG